MRAEATAEIDARVGTSWLSTAGPVERLQLLAALLSRFNHDFRTPLNTITGWAHLLQQGSVDAERGKHVAEVIARNARDQTLMLDAFVEDARIVLDRLPLEPATVRIEDVISQVITRADSAERSRSPAAVQIRIDAVGATVNGDGRLLQRLVERLLRISARGAHGAAVDLQVSREDGWICLALTTKTQDDDWSDAELLELRIGTLMATVFRGALEVLRAPGSTSLRLQLPAAARSK